MIKTYHIEYLFTGGERHLKTTDIVEFALFLDELLELNIGFPETIKIYTEEKKA